MVDEAEMDRGRFTSGGSDDVGLLLGEQALGTSGAVLEGLPGPHHL
jgi:hypothetical protein